MSEQERFERWAERWAESGMTDDKDSLSFNGSRYEDWSVQRLWLTWQARAVLAAEEKRELVDVLKAVRSLANGIAWRVEEVLAKHKEQNGE